MKVSSSSRLACLESGVERCVYSINIISRSTPGNARRTELTTSTSGPTGKGNIRRFPPSGEHRKVLFVSLPRLPASHKRCKVAWFGDAGGSETIETIPNIILIRIHFISQLQQRWWT